MAPDPVSARRGRDLVAGVGDGRAGAAQRNAAVRGAPAATPGAPRDPRRGRDPRGGRRARARRAHHQARDTRHL